jgi:hypothetical protein
MKDGFKEILGKTIESVIVSDNARPPLNQVFLVFTDGSYYEIYGENFTGASGVSPGNSDNVNDYILKLGANVIQVHDTSKNIMPEEKKGIIDEDSFKRLAKSHLITLVLWFVSFLTLTILTSEIIVWAEPMREWQRVFIAGLFYLFRGIALLGVVMFALMILVWFSEYKVALSDSKSLSREDLMRLRSSVIGPFRWGLSR